MQWPTFLRPFFAKVPFIGWFILIAQLTVIGIGKWGDIEFAQEKSPLLIRWLDYLWNTSTDPFWGAVIIMLVGLFIIAMGNRKAIALMEAYNPQRERGGMAAPALYITSHVIFGHGGPIPRFEFATQNANNQKLEAEMPIQAIRFIKPLERIIRPIDCPVIIQCERRLYKRMMNACLNVPPPRIIVKGFTDKGFLFDEEHSKGTSVVVEFYPVSVQSKEN